jgi:hypothetical protein
MLLAALAAAALQAAPAVQTPAAKAPPLTAEQRQEQLACPSTGKLVAKSAGTIKNAFHTLNLEPDAAAIRPIARNYCDPSDVLRTNVSQTPAQTEEPAVPRRVPHIAR